MSDVKRNIRNKCVECAVFSKLRGSNPVYKKTAYCSIGGKTVHILSDKSVACNKFHPCKKMMESLVENLLESCKIACNAEQKHLKIALMMPEIKKLSPLVSENENSTEAQCFCEGFLAGSEWAINKLWRNVPDPEMDKCLPEDILLLLENGAIVEYNSDWHERHFSKIVRWANRKDLIEACIKSGN